MTLARTLPVPSNHPHPRPISVAWWSLVFLASLGCQRSSALQGVYVSPQTASFGVVHAHRVIQHEFQIQNSTPSTVQITDIRLSCGCSTLKIAKRILEPGEIVSAMMSVDLKGKTGRQTFQASLVTDSRVAPVVSLILEGEVIVDRLDSEVFIQLGTFPPDTHISEITWISKGGLPNTLLTGIRKESGPLEVSIETDIEPLENALPVRLFGRTPRSPGAFDTVATATLENGPWRTANIRFRGSVRSRWRYPRDVYLGVVEGGRSLQTSFSILDAFRDLYPSPPIQRVELSDAAPFTAELARRAEGEIVIDVLLPPDSPPGASGRPLVITLMMDDDKREELVVNLYARRID